MVGLVFICVNQFVTDTSFLTVCLLERVNFDENREGSVGFRFDLASLQCRSRGVSVLRRGMSRHHNDSGPR